MRATTPEEMIGKRFGRLTVLSRNPENTHRGGTRWDCRCDCGGETTVSLNRLKTGNTQSCGCKHRDRASQMGKRRKGKRSWNWAGVGEISGEFWGTIRTGAQDRGLELTISIEHAWELFLAQDRKCALTGWPLHFSPIGVRNGQTASLDRVDSGKGYVEGNLQWVHKDIQQMKWTLTRERLVELCCAVVKHAGVMP